MPLGAIAKNARLLQGLAYGWSGGGSQQAKREIHVSGRRETAAAIARDGDAPVGPEARDPLRFSSGILSCVQVRIGILPIHRRALLVPGLRGAVRVVDVEAAILGHTSDFIAAG